MTSILFILDYYERSNDRIYFRGGEPDVPQERDLRIDTVRFLGSEPTNETTGEAYLVKMSVFATRMEGSEGPTVAQWWLVEQEYCVVLGRSMDGKLYEVRGQRNGVDDDIKNIILEESL